MQKPLLASLALAVAASISAPASAQEATPMPSPAPASAPAAPGAPPAAAPHTAPNTAPNAAPMAPQGQPGFADLMNSLNRMKSEVAQVRGLRALSTNDVRIVKVQSIASGNDTAALNSALAKNASQLASLRSALANVRLTATTDNHTLTFAQFLADNRMSMTQVVAADVNAGKLTAFVQ